MRPETLADALRLYEPVIGLEVHAQLLTRTKLFSRAESAYDPDRPNTFVTPYCLGLPGVLPLLNQHAIELAITAGLALDCTINPRSIWSRKQYFYPDLPKGYQISQYEHPLCSNGRLALSERTIPIQRIHVEEDAGKSMHQSGASYSVVDYNRAGVPLIEIVSGPDLRSAQEASQYLKRLRAILVTTGVCTGNLEEGSLRCDANVSLRPRGSEPFGTRCEIKNLNSFRFVEQAIEAEILRQARILAEGGVIRQETRSFDPQQKRTNTLRSKEEADDYRYFPDPDLPPLLLPEGWVEQLRQKLPELPAAKMARYQAMGVPEEHASSFIEEPELATFFDRAIAAHPAQAKGIADLIKGELLRELKDDPSQIRNSKLVAEDLGLLVAAKEADKISSTQQKKLMLQLWRSGGQATELLAAEQQVDDPEALGPLVAEVLAAAPKELEKLRQGQAQIMGFFVGQVMKRSGGKAKPGLVKALIEARLKEPS